MADYSLPRSQKALQVEVAMLAIATVSVAVLSLLLIRFLYHATIGTRWSAGLLVFIAIIVIGYTAVLLRQKKWGAVDYKLTADAILIDQGLGMFSSNKEVYLYESIISASLTQSYIGKKYNFGDIILVIPKLDSTVRLKTLDNPEEQLKKLKYHLKNKVHRQALVT